MNNGNFLKCTFNSRKFGEIRVVLDNNEVYFSTKDVCSALGVTEHYKFVNKYCDTIHRYRHETNGGKQTMNFIDFMDVFHLCEHVRFNRNAGDFLVFLARICVALTEAEIRLPDYLADADNCSKDDYCDTDDYDEGYDYASDYDSSNDYDLCNDYDPSNDYDLCNDYDSNNDCDPCNDFVPDSEYDYCADCDNSYNCDCDGDCDNCDESFDRNTTVSKGKEIRMYNVEKILLDIYNFVEYYKHTHGLHIMVNGIYHAYSDGSKERIA